MTLLKADDVTVRDGATVLLRPVSVGLEPGEPLVGPGETASGKSLLAQVIMGTLAPGLAATGRVALGERVLNTAEPTGFRRRASASVAQQEREVAIALH